MPDVRGVLDNANVKEFAAIVGGNVLGNLYDSAAKDLDRNQRDGLKVVLGLGGAYFTNQYVAGAVRPGGETELMSYGGLALTAMAAQAPSQRVNIEISKKLGKPVVVGSNRPVQTGKQTSRRSANPRSGGGKVVSRGTEPATEKKKKYVTTGR